MIVRDQASNDYSLLLCIAIEDQNNNFPRIVPKSSRSLVTNIPLQNKRSVLQKNEHNKKLSLLTNELETNED
jgi:hypothetical protein